jgi:hypothetical protein
MELISAVSGFEDSCRLLPAMSVPRAVAYLLNFDEERPSRRETRLAHHLIDSESPSLRPPTRSKKTLASQSPA